jgi:hypothetical protein
MMDNGHSYLLITREYQKKKEEKRRNIAEKERNNSY